MAEQTTVDLIPSGYRDLTDITLASQYPISNAYADTTNTNYARLNLSASTTGYIFYTFANPNIPQDASIVSVACLVKVRVVSTTRVLDTKAQLFSGSNAKGENTTFASSSSSNVITLSTGTWTASDTTDIRLKIGGTGYSGTSTRYIYMYGAKLTIVYSIGGKEYSVSVKVNGVWKDGEVFVKNGGAWKEASQILVKDGSWK